MLGATRPNAYIDSEHHLIDNGIISSARDTYNAIEIAYVDDTTQAFGSPPGPPPNPQDRSQRFLTPTPARSPSASTSISTVNTT